jgi:carbon-monoxide dehydrogenase medium subunit
MEEVWDIKSKIPRAKFIAGGTDLMVQIRSRDVTPPALISLRSVPELAAIEPGDATRLGAMTTITDFMNREDLTSRFPLLLEAARQLACVQIRNVATLGGNLCRCSPCADTATPLLVMDAKVRLRNPQTVREIPISEFFMGPGQTCLAPNEILTAIRIETPSKAARSIFLKKGRVKMDLAVASLSVLMEMDGETCRRIRIAAGSVAPVPIRLYKVEALLEGRAINPELLARAREIASESVSPISDVRSSDEYRREITGVYVQRAVETLLGWERA